MKRSDKTKDAPVGKNGDKRNNLIRLLKKAKDLAKPSEFKADCVTHCK